MVAKLFQVVAKYFKWLLSTSSGCYVLQVVAKYLRRLLSTSSGC